MHTNRRQSGAGPRESRAKAQLGPTMEEWNNARLRIGKTQPATHRAARWHIKKMTHYLGEPTPVADITADDMGLFVECLADDGLEIRSRNQILSTARTFFGWARTVDLTDRNPMEGVHNTRAPRRAVRAVPPQHVSLILDHADLRVRTIIVLLAQIGFRRGELAGILWDDYDDRSGVLLIRQGKGQRDHTVVLEREPAEALAAWRAHLTELRTPAQGPLRTGPVFPGQKPGEALSPGRLYTLVTDAAHKVGLHYTPHQYRHTCATQWTKAGASTAVVARQLGHADLSSAQHYIELDVEDLRPHVARRRYLRTEWIPAAVAAVSAHAAMANVALTGCDAL